MKIVLVNYRYFISGGPERYYFNIKEILEKYNHEVIPFSIKNSHNNSNNYEQYFLDAVDDEVYFAQAKKSVRVILKSFSRMFYSFEAKKKFKRLLRDVNPDLIYVLQYHNKISPSIIGVANDLRIPIIHRISDFQYMCPNALFYNDVIGVCEDCLHGKRLSCIKYKCVLNSTIYSTIKAAAKGLHDFMGIKNKIDAFVIPSAFTLQKLHEYGIPMTKLNHIPTFFNLKEEDVVVEYKPYILFIGRIEKQKGLMTLIKAFQNTSYNLKIIGFSNGGYEDELKSYLQGKEHHIEFLGRKSFEEIVPYLKSCLCTIVPSEWYDNFPNVILESFAYKKAVIATNFGSLPELVIDGETGLLFDYADERSLQNKVQYMFEYPENAKLMGEHGYQAIISKYSPSVHFEKLMSLFEKMHSEYRKIHNK